MGYSGRMKRSVFLVRAGFVFLVVLSAPGCWGAHVPKGPRAVRPKAPPALIGHIVFVSLKDPGRVGALRRDADAMLGTIPSVATYAAGGHLDTRRATVLGDYDLAIYLGFASQQDLAAYVAHEQHVRFVERWKPMISELRVHDMLDEPDAPPQPRCVVAPRKKFLGIF